MWSELKNFFGEESVVRTIIVVMLFSLVCGNLYFYNKSVVMEKAVQACQYENRPLSQKFKDWWNK